MFLSLEEKKKSNKKNAELPQSGYNCDQTNVRKNGSTNKFVTPRTRNKSAIRGEIVQSATTFLEQRINVEEDGIISNLIAIFKANSPKEFIEPSRILASQILG